MQIFDSIRGISTEGLDLKEDAIRKSISCDVNFGVRLKSEADLEQFLCDLSGQLSKRMQDEGLIGMNLTLKLMVSSKSQTNYLFRFVTPTLQLSQKNTELTATAMLSLNPLR